MSNAAPRPDIAADQGGVHRHGPVGQRRRGRALIGWMTAEDATRALVGGQMDVPIELDVIRRAQSAREEVAARAEPPNQEGVIEDAPPELAAHVASLGQQPGSTQMLAEGWEVKLTDLARLVAFQPLVIAEQAEERVANITADDINSVATATLPIAQPEPLPAAFDQSKGCWVISSANPNLQVCGHFTGPLQPGTPPAFGFVVGVLPSFVQAARYQGRYFLRDGYHRAYGLLKRGIMKVPALVREIETIDALGVKPGMLPQEAYLGPQPPMLRDFLNDAVSADVTTAAIHKVIAVHAIELTPLV